MIDDLPHLSVSRLRAAGLIRPDDKTTTVQFPAPDDTTTFVVALQHIRFSNGGGWSFFQCPCGRRCRTLRLYNGSPACKHCLGAKGLRYRVTDLSKPERAAYAVSRLKARLMSDTPARLHPRPGRRLDRRSHFAAALWRAEYVAARHGFRDLIDAPPTETSGQLR
jgi:hypothetical protein